MKKFVELSDSEKQFYYDKAVDFFNGKDLLYCTRVWNAWQYNSMSEDDFLNVEDDDDLIHELAEFIYDIVKVKERKFKIGNLLNNE